MSNEIISTHHIAEQDWDGGSEPQDVPSDIVATHEPENKGIEFHVSMRDYTMNDMEALIVEAAARMIVGRRNDHEMAKAIEERCIDLISKKADAALAGVTAEIIDQPITPKYNFVKPSEPPVTMREFIGLTGRDYLNAFVDSSGKPTTDRHYGRTRMQYLVENFMQRAFKLEIEKATSAAIAQIQSAIRARHEEILTAEKQRVRDAIAKATGEA